MTTVLLTIHIIIAIALVGIILIQKNEGGGLGIGGGGGTMGGLMSARGTANLLTHVTAVLATLFFLSTLGLAIVFKGGNKPKSILDVPATTAPVVPGESPKQPVEALSSPVVPALVDEKAKKAVPEKPSAPSDKATK
jgi:preprotein translocase subunit SecG